MEEFIAYIMDQDYGRYPYRYDVFKVLSTGAERFFCEEDDFETVEEAERHARRGFQYIRVVK